MTSIMAEIISVIANYLYKSKTKLVILSYFIKNKFYLKDRCKYNIQTKFLSRLPVNHNAGQHQILPNLLNWETDLL